MVYYSTRNRKILRTPSEAIVEGIAPDGGLYLPEQFPAFPMETLLTLSGIDISVEVLSLLLDDFSKEELNTLVHAAYDNSFENGEIAPLKSVGDHYIMELWHGPTYAFKDVALQLLPHLLTAAAKKCGVSDEICILTATSGDTGSAALAGFSEVEGTRIIVFYPDGGVSPMQKRQMVTCPGKNTSVCAIKGNFDDAQSGVKKIFAEAKPPKGMRFSSANSINIGRLAPQIAYYFTAYRDLVKMGKISFGDPVNFVVPTGNFGDILAGYFAKKMGLPVGTLVSASNENRVLADFFASGLYDRRREFYLTSSPSMDILISSNLERLIALVCGEEKTERYMKDLRENGVYQIEKDDLDKIRTEFSAAWVNGEETAETIRTLFEMTGYLADPHTAVGVCAMKKWLAELDKDREAPTVVLSTASPYKFTRHVLTALGEQATEDEFADVKHLEAISHVPISASLAALEKATVQHKDVVAIDEMANYVMKKTREAI